MSPEQFDFWKDFSIRMARTAFRKSRRPNTAWIVAAVEDFFWRMDDIEKAEDWDSEPVYLCDRFSDWKDYYLHDRFYEICNVREAAKLDSLRNKHEYDEMDDIKRAIVERFSDPVACCIRAGIGAAIDGGSGMGVMGFSAGDIRRMYPEGVPDRIARSFDDADIIGTSTVVPGVGFIPEVLGKSPRFEDMPDEAALWL